MSFFARYSPAGKVKSSASRQPTASHGLDGVKLNRSPSPTTVTGCVLAQPLAQFIGSAHAGEAGSENDDLGHGKSPVVRYVRTVPTRRY